MDEIIYESAYHCKPTQRQLRTITKLVKVLRIDPIEPAPTNRLEAHNILDKLEKQLREKYE